MKSTEQKACVTPKCGQPLPEGARGRYCPDCVRARDNARRRTERYKANRRVKNLSSEARERKNAKSRTPGARARERAHRKDPGVRDRLNATKRACRRVWKQNPEWRASEAERAALTRQTKFLQALVPALSQRRHHETPVRDL